MIKTWKRVICIACLFLVSYAAHAVTPMILAGHGSSYYLHSDGSVWATETSPRRMFELPDIVAIAWAGGASFALRADGTLWAAGRNDQGLFGDGTKQTISRGEPQPVLGLSGIKEVAGSDGFVLALKDDGTVWAWGNNEYGQLGDGTRTSRLAPVKVKGLPNIVMVAAGIGHGAALTSDGHVWVRGGQGIFRRRRPELVSLR